MIKKLAIVKKSTAENTHPRDNAEPRWTLLIFLLVCTSLLVSSAITLIVWKVSPTIVCLSYCKQSVAPHMRNDTAIHSDRLIIPRAEWMAIPSKAELTKLNLPVPYIIISHTVTLNCSTKPQCIFNVGYIQLMHQVGNNWWDIGYNFLVGGDGLVYEGRGWYKEGAHARGYNNRSLGISFIGNFTEYLPHAKQIKAYKKFIEEGIKLGYISRNYKLLAHRQISITESPGQALFEEMKNWENWSLEP